MDKEWKQRWKRSPRSEGHGTEATVDWTNADIHQTETATCPPFSDLSWLRSKVNTSVSGLGRSGLYHNRARMFELVQQHKYLRPVPAEHLTAELCVSRITCFYTSINSSVLMFIEFLWNYKRILDIKNGDFCSATWKTSESKPVNVLRIYAETPEDLRESGQTGLCLVKNLRRVANKPVIQIHTRVSHQRVFRLNFGASKITDRKRQCRGERHREGSRRTRPPPPTLTEPSPPLICPRLDDYLCCYATNEETCNRNIGLLMQGCW